jgi:hypothetical protein
MTTKRAKSEVYVHDPSKLKGELKAIGGSMCDDWNNIVANQTISALWFFQNTDQEEVRRRRHATVDALIGINPRDELEGMLAAQLIACHNASMDCYRRAMIREQTFEGRDQNLTRANKLSRTYTSLLEALNRHRGRGQQKVTVEHVHVHEGGQAIVGSVAAGGGGKSKSEDQPHAKPIVHEPGQTLPSADRSRDGVPIARNEERALQDARRTIDRRTEGES